MTARLAFTRHALLREWRLKLVMAGGLSLAFCVPYFALQRGPWWPIWTVPSTPVDTWIAFDPAWTWAYQTVYALLPLPALFATARADLKRFCRGFLLLSFGSFVIFLCCPTVAPQPAVLPEHTAYRFLRSYDGSLNSFPSLHAGLGLYAILFGASLLERPHRGRWIAVTSLWLAVIVYASIATKQHWALDMPAGLVAGYLSWCWQKYSDRAPRPALLYGASS